MSDEAIELRVRDGLPLLERMARHMHRRFRDLAEQRELMSAGYLGLQRAAELFDPSRGVPFLRYAWYRIDGEMTRLVQKRIALAAAARQAGRRAVTLLDDRGGPGDDERSQRRQLTAYCDAVVAAMFAGVVSEASARDAAATPAAGLDALHRALGALPSELRDVVERHYLGGETLRDLAAGLGVSYATIRRRHQAGLEALGAALREESPR